MRAKQAAHFIIMDFLVKAVRKLLQISGLDDIGNRFGDQT
jgi:hypothetical protein